MLYDDLTMPLLAGCSVAASVYGGPVGTRTVFFARPGLPKWFWPDSNIWAQKFQHSSGNLNIFEDQTKHKNFSQALYFTGGEQLGKGLEGLEFVVSPKHNSNTAPKTPDFRI